MLQNNNKFKIYFKYIVISGDELGAEFVSFDTLLKESDFIIITSALNDETRGIFNEAAFKKMKNTAILVDTSRGGNIIIIILE